MSRSSNLVRRVLFALVAIPPAWWIINSSLDLLPESVGQALGVPQGTALYPGHILAIILVFGATVEYLRMLSIAFPRNGFWLTYFWLGFQLTSYFIPQISFSLRSDLYVLLLVVALEAMFWGKNTARWKRASLLFSGIVFISIAGISLLSLYASPFSDIFPDKFTSPLLSQMGIITILTAIFLCDSAAYFVGSSMGRHHFSSISPKKTTEGSVAGLIAATIVSAVGWHFFAADIYPLWAGILMGIIIGIFAQLGDLTVSLMKRYFKVKDASHLIPGHGGILDRFDSVFFTVPILNVFFIIVVNVFG